MFLAINVFINHSKIITMKRLILFLISFIFSITLFAKHVPETIAEKAALNQYSTMLAVGKHQSPSLLRMNLTFGYSSQGLLPLNGTNNNPEILFYIFNINQDNGFVLISADDCAYPVLGYSLNGTFSGENIPPALSGMLKNYASEISFIIDQKKNPEPAVIQEWIELLNKTEGSHFKSISAVDPLLNTTWDQSPYYNDLCPYDYNYNELTVTGCPATAMAQIMKFWNYPESGTGYHSYNSQNYGTLSANFGATTYNWNAMPNNINGPNTAIATLMFHCGVAVEMQYGVAETGGSGGYVIESQSPVQHCCEYAFKTYFGYKNTLQGLVRDDFNDATWIQKIKTDLDAGRPVQYAGFGQGGGHTWVCDGYDNNNYFHMNWGWSGIYNGFYSLNNLSPGTGGAGGGSGNFTDGQQALFGIEPASGGSGVGQFDIRAYSSITVSPNPINFTDAFDVSIDIGNFDNSNFSGSFAAALFNSEGNFVDFIQELTGISLQSNYYLPCTFHSDGLLATPGQYYIGIYYAVSGGDYLIIGPGDYSNYLEVTIAGPSNTMQMYSTISIDPLPIISNESFQIVFSIANYGSQTFNGLVSADLYDAEGTYLVELAETNIQLQSMYYYQLTFSCPGVNVDGGSYILAIWDQPTGGNWVLAGSETYSNPITIQIAAPQVSPDIYEMNNDEQHAFNLPLNIPGTSVSVTTEGSNIHEGNDIDYYKIDFPAGTQYQLTPRVHDSHSSGNGQIYSDNVIWSYKIGNTWSESFDDIMPGSFTIDGGQSVYFSVSNYFQGSVGTYLLDVLVKKGTFGIEEYINPELITLYPNPAGASIRLISDNWNDLKLPLKIEIFNLSGENLLQRENIIPDSKEITLGLSFLPNGQYVVKISGKEGVINKKFIKLQ